MSALPKITLFQPPSRPWKTPNLSPFCVKLETYLRMAEIPHDVKSGKVFDAPKGKIPWVSLDGELMGDSQLIIERIEAMRDAPLDAWLSAEQRAVGHSVRRMLEEAFYFVVMHLRWNSEWTNTHQREAFTQVLPGPIKWFFPMIARDVRKILRTQGTGRHTDGEVQGIGKADVTALATLLGDKNFLFGDKPSTYDATAFAFITSVLGFPGDSAIRSHTLAQKNLVAYRDRMHAKYFADIA